MLKMLNCIMIGMLLTQPVRSYDVVPTDKMCAEMLAEFSACFSGARTVEQLTSEWKWGDIREAFGFDFIADPERAVLCMVFGACPPQFKTSTYPLEEEEFLFRGQWPFVRDLENCYWALGVKTDQISVRRQSLAFVYCSRRNAMYRLAHKHLGLEEPQYEDVRTKQPSLCWDTVMHDETQFVHSGADVQVVPWGALNAEIEVLYLFYRRTCMGVMLLNRKSIPKETPRSVPPSPDMATRDFSRLDEEFRWFLEIQVEDFAKWHSEYFAKWRPGYMAQSGEDRRNRLNRVLTRHKDNGDFMRHLGTRFLGVLRHPQPMNYYAPWSNFYYFESPGNNITLRSVWGGRDGSERIDFFVVDLKDLPEEARILLPYGLDIKPYLHTPPSSGVLYEHVRGDKRSRIVVQPHIAYLYEHDRLVKILVCHDKKGPRDHGWSLVRELYVCEETGYFWPVRRAYSPLEN